MHEFIEWLTYLLGTVGLTVLIVWPQRGPSAFLRERVLRRLLPSAGQEVLDCYLCCSFWCGLFLSPLWWCVNHAMWCWSACLIVPAIFWFALGRPAADESVNETSLLEKHHATTENNSQSS